MLKISDKVKNEVLSPMRESGQDISEEQEEINLTRQENPFEVADNNCRLQELVSNSDKESQAVLEKAGPDSEGKITAAKETQVVEHEE